MPLYFNKILYYYSITVSYMVPLFKVKMPELHQTNLSLLKVEKVKIEKLAVNQA